MVVGNNVVRIGRNGTIHKLIVIRIDCNQIKVIEWSYQFNKRTVQYGFHHIFRRFIVGKSLQNFYIFLQYFIGYTELVLSVHKGLPQDMVTTPLRNALNKTIRTKNQLAIDVILMNGYPFQLFHPAFLVKNSLIPKFIQLCIHPFGIILKEHLFQFFQTFLRFIVRKHFQQMPLYGVEYCNFHNYIGYKFYANIEFIMIISKMFLIN